jgi:hypothetical protein
MSTQRCALIAPALLGLAGSLACSDPNDSTRVIGLIDASGGHGVTVDLPSDVVRGRPFEVTVYTFGSSSCTRPDGAGLKVDGLVARITPYDHVPAGAGVPCTADLARFPHPVSVRFDREGVGTLRIVGWTFQGERRSLDSVDLSFPVHP